MFLEEPRKRRRNFTAITKRAALIASKGKCMSCRQQLDARSTEYDHKDNNPANNNESNCWVVCSNCHRKHTVITKRAVRDLFGDVIGYQTIKRKVGYKKPATTQAKSKTGSKKTTGKGTTTKRRRTQDDFLGF